MNKFTSISLYGVDTSGLNFVVAGIWQGQKFEVEMNIAGDPKNIKSLQFDSNPTSGSGFDPFEDGTALRTLTQDQRFISLMKQGKQIRDMLLKVQ